MAFNEQFIRCVRCTNQVPGAYLDSRGVCINCRTRGKPSEWQLREAKRLERQEEKISIPICDICREPKSNAGFCRKCGK